MFRVKPPAIGRRIRIRPFHVKRRPSGAHPEAIAAEVRARVERALERLHFAPAASEFMDRIQKLAAALAFWGARMNLTARPDDPGAMAFHVVDSLMPFVLASRADGAALRDAFADRHQVLDLGSGAGFPGLVLAAASNARFTLCESRRKRATFLSVAIAEMGLENVTVAATRAAAESFEPIFDVAMARAVGDLAGFYRIAAAALRQGGIAMLYAAPAQRLEVKHAPSAPSLTRLEYEVDRAGESVKRVIALWRQPSAKARLVV